MKLLKAKISIAILITIMVISLVLLIYFGFAVVRPFRYTTGFLRSKCKAAEVNRTADPPYGFLECICTNQPYGCSSVFPCVRIIIEYNSTNGKEQTTTIFKDHKALNDELPCSYMPCKRSPLANILSVESFVDTYGPQSAPYDCFYNPEKLFEVILERPSETTVAMVMFWPILIIVLCAIVIGIVIFKVKT